MTDPTDFLEQIGTWTDLETGLSVSPVALSEAGGTWAVEYLIEDGQGVQVGTSRFQYVSHCDTVHFLSIDLGEAANQGFMTRWLSYGATVMREFGVRRATSSPQGYAVNVFESADWTPNSEDGLGTMCCYYGEVQVGQSGDSGLD